MENLEDGASNANEMSMSSFIKVKFSILNKTLNYLRLSDIK